MKKILTYFSNTFEAFKSSHEKRLFEVNLMIFLIIVNTLLSVFFSSHDWLYLVGTIGSMLISYFFVVLIVVTVFEFYINLFEKENKIEGDKSSIRSINIIRTRLLLGVICLFFLIDTIGLIRFKFSIINVLGEFIHDSGSGYNDE